MSYIFVASPGNVATNMGGQIEQQVASSDVILSGDEVVMPSGDVIMSQQTNDFRPWITAKDKKLTITLQLDRMER